MSFIGTGVEKGEIIFLCIKMALFTPPNTVQAIANKKYVPPLQLLVFSAFVISALFYWQGNIGFSLWDEGYLWYGVQRVMLGEVPIRDFMSYDPGRYYWSAALMGVWGNNGIMALRGAVAVFQTMGLFAGLWLIARTEKKQNFFYLFLSTIILVAWMFPRHKLFDISLSILLIGVLTFLVQSPTRKRYFLAGLCIGVVAVFGRNHGAYGVAGSIGVMLWLNIRQAERPGFIKRFLFWTAGVIIGYMPVILMALLVPGFADAFWQGLRFLLSRGSTNLPLPIPWPWHISFTSASFGDAIRGVLIGLFFIGTVAFGVLSIIWVTLQKFRGKPVSPALVAASFMALPYAHYAYSRADAGHLAQGIFPLLIGCLVLLATQPARIKWPLAFALCAASLCATLFLHPGWQCRTGNRCVNVEISGSNLLVTLDTARDIKLLRQLTNQYASAGKNFIAAPFWPGAYALFHRKSPMWAIYALWARGDAFQKQEIERIRSARPGFAIILDMPLDGREELRFRNTNPLIYQYILDNFERLPDSPTPLYQIFKARGNGQ